MVRVWTRTKKQTLTSVKNPLELVTATLNRPDFRPPFTGATTEELESEEGGRKRVQIFFFL